MSNGTKHPGSKLSNRLAALYAALFSGIFLLLSVGIFLLAYKFLVQKQWDHLKNTMELVNDHLIEEVEEGESLSEPEILQELNADSNLSLFLYDSNGTLINRVLNFPLSESILSRGGRSPEPVFLGGRLLLRATRQVTDGNEDYGRLYLVYQLTSETSFLKLLGFLLLGANLVGAAASVLVGRAASRRMLSPVSRMIAAANGIDSANLDARLDVPEPDDELRSLALTINGMLDRVSASFRQQGRFVADVSHELRTPLAVLQGNVDLLARWGRDDRAVLDGSLAAIQRQTEYMNRLVENLLFLARCDNAQTQLSVGEFSALELFDELIEEQSLIDPGHTYERAVESGAELIAADRAMVRQALRALLDNSAQYTPANGTITLRCAREEPYWALTVADTGVGLDSEHLKHIFERFYRVDRARARATGGMGLGLSIVAAIAEAHGGCVRAESEPGVGAAVTILLPLEDDED